VTPTGSGDWNELRFVSEAFEAAPRTVTSNEIRSDRMVADMPKVGLDVNGSFDFEFSSQDFDDFIEAAMCGTWTTNVVNIGTTDRSFSLEKNFEDLASTIIAYKGLRVGEMALNFAYGELVTGSFTFQGNDTTAIQATQVSAYTTATTNEIFDAAAGITSLKVDGASVDGCIFKSVAFTVNNNLRPIEAMGYDAACNISKGRAMVTGSFEIYFTSNAYYEKLIANTAVELEFTVSDGSKTYTFRWPSLKFSSGTPQATGIDTDVMQSLEWTALYDTSAGTSMRITRT
jgi:hypothetical protein